MFYTVKLPSFRREEKVEVVRVIGAPPPMEPTAFEVYSNGIALLLADGTIRDKLSKSFDPIVELIQGISEPVAFLMLCSGMLFIMVGQRHKGLSMIKWAAVGYIGMQLAPGLMRILADVGESIR